MRFFGKSLMAGVGLLATLAADAQDNKWSLQRCVEYAMQHNIGVQAAEIGVQEATLTYEQAQRNRLPNANGGASLGMNLGRSINPFTNQFETNAIFSNNFSVQSSTPIYTGGRLVNSITQAAVNMDAAGADVEQRKYDLALSVSTAYLQVLFQQEILASQKVQLSSTNEQLARTQKLIAGGVLPQANAVQIEAQIATEELTIINTENQIEVLMQNLRQLMNADAAVKIDAILPPTVLPEPISPNAMPSVAAIYEVAEPLQPGIRALRLRERSAAVGVEIAKSSILPSLSFSALGSTGYSSTSRKVSGYNTVKTAQTVYLAGQPATIEVEQNVPTFEKNPYFNQLATFRSFQFGLNLNVPIYDRRQTRTNVNLAMLAIDRARLQTEQQQLSLRQNIQQASVDAKNAYTRYHAIEKQIAALQLAFKNTEKQYELGVVNSLDFLLAKNNLNRAQYDLIQAKYESLFRAKILDFYQGKPITLE